MIDQLDPKFVAAYAHWLGVTEGEAYALLEAEPLIDLGPVEDVTAAGWDEAAHPRHPEGSEQGGEFAPKLSGGKLTAEQLDVLKGYRHGLSLNPSTEPTKDQTYRSGHFMNNLLRGKKWKSDVEAAEHMMTWSWNVSAEDWDKTREVALGQIQKARANVKVLDRAIKQSVLEEDYTVYRGMSYPSDAMGRQGSYHRIRMRDDPQSFVGKKFTDRGFVATTYDPEVARKGFGKGEWTPGWVMRFTVPKGTPALLVQENGIKSGLKDFESESELLLGRNHSFVVRRVDEETRMIDLELTK
jgi:hypothetical protein